MIGEYWDYGKQCNAADRADDDLDDRPIRLLLVEDRRGSMDSLADYLRRQRGLQIDATSDSGLLAGVRAIFDKPDVLLVSADLVGFTAWDTARLVKQLTPGVAVVVLGCSAQPRGPLRHSECPDAIVEDPQDYGSIASLVRAVHAHTGTDAVAALQRRSPPGAGTH
jgi:DNA-binding NarL/FixJ family response regulator